MSKDLSIIKTTPRKDFSFRDDLIPTNDNTNNNYSILAKNLNYSYDNREILTNFLIKTFCRIKPSENGSNLFYKLDDEFISTNFKEIKNSKIKNKIRENKNYRFNKIFEQNSSQSEVFKYTCKSLVYDYIFNHKSGLIFTYGAENSGKTYTVLGNDKNPGILFQALQNIFRYNKKEKNKSNNFYISILEVFKEEIIDLLCDGLDEKNKVCRKIIKIKENSNSFVVDDASYAKLINLQSTKEIINKAINKSNLEHNSSSHLLFKIIMLNNKSIEEINFLSNELISLCFGIIGSREKQNDDDNNKINKSINNLEKCLKIMKNNTNCNDKKIVPLKDSELTKLLAEYFLGKKKIKIINNINPTEESFEESIRSINIICLPLNIELHRSQLSKISFNLSKNTKITNERETKNLSKISNNDNNIIDEIDDFISKNCNKYITKNINKHISQNINKIFDNNDKFRKNKRFYHKNKSQFLTSNENNTFINDKIEILINEIKLLREEVNQLKSENKENYAFLNRGSSFSKNFSQNIQNKNEFPIPNNYLNPFFINPFSSDNNFNYMSAIQKYKENYEKFIQSKNTQNEKNSKKYSKIKSEVPAFNPFEKQFPNPFINPFNPFFPFPYEYYFQNNPFLGKTINESKKINEKSQSQEKTDENKNDSNINEENEKSKISDTESIMLSNSNKKSRKFYPLRKEIIEDDIDSDSDCVPKKRKVKKSKNKIGKRGDVSKIYPDYKINNNKNKKNRCKKLK